MVERKQVAKLITKYVIIQNLAFIIGILGYFIGGMMVKWDHEIIATIIMVIIPPACGLLAIITPKLFLKEYERMKLDGSDSNKGHSD